MNKEIGEKSKNRNCAIKVGHNKVGHLELSQEFVEFVATNKTIFILFNFLGSGFFLLWATYDWNFNSFLVSNEGFIGVLLVSFFLSLFIYFITFTLLLFDHTQDKKKKPKTKKFFDPKFGETVLLLNSCLYGIIFAIASIAAFLVNSFSSPNVPLLISFLITYFLIFVFFIKKEKQAT